jgi:hypothetical protein
MKLINLKNLFVAILILTGNQAFGCDCADKPSVIDSWNSKDQIFVGHLISKDTTNSYDRSGTPLVRYTFEIKEFFKGPSYNASNKRTIYSISFRGSCDSHFELNRDYLVYGSIIRGFLLSSSCSRTEELSRVSQGEISKLRDLKKEYKNPKVIIDSYCGPIEKDLEVAHKQITELNRISRILYGIISVLLAMIIFIVIMNFRRKKQTPHNTV